MKEEQIEISLIFALIGNIFILFKIFLFPSFKRKIVIWKVLLLKTIIEIFLLWGIFLHLSMKLATYVNNAGRYIMMHLCWGKFDYLSIKYFFVFCVKNFIEQSIPLLILFDTIYSIEISRVFIKGTKPYILKLTYAVIEILFFVVNISILDGFSIIVFISFSASISIQIFTIKVIGKVGKFTIGDNKHKFCNFLKSLFVLSIGNGALLYFYNNVSSSQFVGEWFPSIILVFNFVQLYLQCYLLKRYQFENEDYNILSPKVVPQSEMTNVTEK